MRAHLLFVVAVLTLAVPTSAVAGAATGSSSSSATATKHRHHKKPARRKAPAPTVSAAPANPAREPAECAGATVVPDAHNGDVVAAATLCLINQERSAHGVAALTVNSALTQAASLKVQDLLSLGYFSHDTPAGAPFSALLTTVGYAKANTTYRIGENLAWAQGKLSSPAETVNLWMNSPGHRANILDGGFRESGISVLAAIPASATTAVPGLTGATYVQEFGSRG